MSLKNRRFFIVLVLSLGVHVSRTQTLYWVGGSGNFNDSLHWSTTSGGQPSGLLPNAKSKLVFDYGNQYTNTEIYFTGLFEVGSIQVNAYKNTVLKAMVPGAKLQVRHSFDNLIDNQTFKIAVPLEFRNVINSDAGYINLGNCVNEANVSITVGKWTVNTIKLSRSRKVLVSGANVNFDHSVVEAGKLEFDNCTALEFNGAVLQISDEVSVQNCNNYLVVNSLFAKKFCNGTLAGGLASVSFTKTNKGNPKLNHNNQINAVCWSATLVTAPSCFPGCDGKVVVTLPALSCWNTPALGGYDIQVSNGCSTVTGLSNVGPGTYTLGGFCACFTQYAIIVTDQTSSLLDDSNGPSIASIAVAAPNIQLISSSSKSVSCFGLCDGSVSATFFGGTTPYSFTVSAPSATPTFTSSNASVSQTGLCAGVVTIAVNDANACAFTYTRNIASPSVLSANATSLNLSCFSVCNGGFSVAPIGGTPNYTVNFSSGATLSTTANGTVFVNSLCVGPITATVTDSKGCQAITGATLTQPSALVVTSTQTDVTCSNVCTGITSVAVSGGGGAYNYTWSPSGGNGASASGLCAGNYTVSIMDNLGCSATRSFVITQPASITLVPTIINPTCNAGCNGAATVAASGPTSAISFTWLAPPGVVISTVNSISGQCAGVYTVIAKDAPSSPTCVATSTINITQPPAVTLTALTQSITCATNSCSGSATITAGGGNGSPFTYLWMPGGQTTTTVNSMCTGDYTVSVSDASNCVSTTTLSIVQPTTFTPNISSTTITCNGACSGVINSSPVGGSAPYSFTLISSGFTVTTAPPYTNLCVGNYSLLIKDSSPTGCAQTFTTTLQQAPALVPSINTTSITCFNVCNGALAGNVSGGTPSYTFSWATPTGTVAGGTLSGRCAGVYTLNVSDANNCTASLTNTLTQPTDITVSIVPTDVTCFSSCNGVLSGNASGGTPGYTMSWSNGFTGNPNTDLCVGAYTLTVTDAAGCVKTATSSVGSPSAIVLSQTVTPVSCSGNCDGTATVVATGGSPPFSYTFNTVPPTTNTSGVVTGLCVGNYVASVSDANSCPQSIAFSITSPPLLSAAITGTQNSCVSCTGAATVTASNGTPGYSYVWTNSLNATVSNAATASALCSGDYTVRVTDSNSCVALATVNIQQTVISAAVSGGVGIQCFGACTGSAVVSPSGGTAPYNYTWTPGGQSTQTATGLCAGNYTVIVKEQGSSGCMSTATINIVSPSSITVSGITSNLSCFGVCNGVVSTTASGGTGSKTFSWSPGGQTTSSIASQCAGTYTLRVADANGCTIAPQTFTITEPSSVTATFSNTTPTGCSLSNGSICATPSGGSGSGYTFSWSPVSSTASCITGLASGSYSVVISDGAGCARTLSSLLNSPAGPTITVSQQSVTCFGGNNGSATISASGTPPFTYSWVAGNTPTASGLVSGTYVASVQDGNSCVTNQAIIITQPASLAINSNTTASKCVGGPPTGSITLAPTGGTSPFTYAWSGPSSFTSNAQNITGLSPGIYSLTVTDAQSCSNQFTFNMTSPPAITVTANSTKTVVCNGVTNGSIMATASGGTPPLSFSWTPVGSFTGASTATVLNLSPGVYSVHIIDGNNCVSSTATWTLGASTLTSSIIQQSASCSNSCNASATLNVTGGAPTFSFNWSSGTSTTNIQSNLCVGNYTATVVDGDGCVSQKGFTVLPVSLLSITVTPSQPLCNATCNGSAAVTTTGAVGAVNYLWSPAGSGQNPTGMCAGVYTVVVTDNNSCSATSIITLTNPAALLANVTSTNPLCNNNCNGVAVINPTNAVGTVTVTWLPGSFNSPTISSLCAGNYTATVQDANGCQDTHTFVLTNPPLLTVNSSVGPATCGSSNGSITLVPGGGTPGYTYTWSPNVSNTVSATGLAAQVYTVVVSDNSNCTNTVTIPVGNSNGPVAVISTTNLTCFGQCIGAIEVGAISGGLPPYQPPLWISPLPVTTVNPRTNLCAGIYIVELEDNVGCKTYTGATITQPTSVSVVLSMGLPTCNGVCNGSITVNASGGNSPYTYSWTPAAPNTSVLTGLCVGNYTVMIGHTGGACAETHTFSLPAQVNVTFTDNITNNTCFGNCNGAASVAVIPTFGIPSPFVFSWSNGQTGPGPLTSSVNALCNGVYTVVATGANGCFNTHTVNISSPTQLTVSSVVTQPDCNVCNGSTTVTAGGGSGSTYTYSWSNGSNTSTLGNLCAGLYQLTVQDNLGCSQTTTVVINNSSGILGHTVTTQDIPCGAICTGAATIAASGTNIPISYNWISPVASGSIMNNLCPGIYFVQMQDAQGCIRNASLSINAASNITLTPFISPPSCGFTNGTVSIAVAGGTPAYNFAWFPAAPNSATLINVGPGSYTITVTDSSPSGCLTSSVINISNLTGPMVAISVTNINCFNMCTGSVLASVTGTASPYTYNWNTGGSSPGLTNVCQGVLTLTVTDTNSCITVQSAAVNQNSEINVGVPAVTQPSCNLCNGAVAINPVGGTGPYSFLWASGATTSSVSNLCAGLFQVTITDNLGCQKTQNIVINNSNGITGHTFSVQNVTCGNNCNGGATVTPVGGNLPITYSWFNPSLPNTGNSVNNLCAGIYFVQMQDAQGCLRTASTNVNTATSITLSPFIAAPGCGLTNGSINVSVAGGIPTYNFAWLPVSGSTGTVTGIGPGSYTLIVSDSSPGGCSTSTVFNVSSQNAPAVVLSTTNISCYSACTGIVQANVTGTASPFTYNWSGGGNAPTVTNLCSGVITVTVTDTNNCVAIKSGNITENVQLLAGMPTVMHPTCNQCNGQVVVNAFGGVGPYSYTWTSGATGSVVSSLCAGLYQVLITDNFNCQQTQNIVVNNSTGITGHTFMMQNVPCINSCNGGATVTPSGGTPPLSFSWINPALTSTLNSANNLCVGTYFVKMTDARGCVRTGSVNILAGSDMTVTSNVVPPGCGLTNGIISLNVTGGTVPYTYNWSPVSGSSSSLTGLGPGNYTVIVTDQNGSGCTETFNFNLSNLNGPSLSYTQTNIACFGLCNGLVNAVSIGTAATTYSWSTGSAAAGSGTACAGVITLTASANGCQTIKSFTIDQEPKLEMNYSTKNISCLNACDGFITLQPVGGKLAYIFGGTSASNSNQTATLCVGDYTLSVTDVMGCMADTVIRLRNPVPLTSTVNTQNSSCSTIADGSVMVVISGGAPAYQYFWSGPASYTANTGNINNIFAGTYTLSVTDSLGCKKDSVLKIIPTVTIEAIAGLDTLVCPGTSVILSGLRSKGASSFSWLLLPSPIIVANTSTFVLANVIDSYTYELTAVSAVPSCLDKDTVVVTAFTVPYLDAGPSYTIPVFSTVTIGGYPTTSGIGTVTWSPSFNLDNTHSENPVASNTTDITYTVTMLYGMGCTASDTMQVFLFPEVRVTSGFSPNNDGKNDVWLIDYLEQFPNSIVEIFNRWGERLFYSQGYAEPFNGRYRGKDLPVGTYYYVIRLNHPAYPKPYTGPVTIFR